MADHPTINPRNQILLDFDYDERVVRLAAEFAIMLAPFLATGTTAETTKELAARLALLAHKQLPKPWEPPEPIPCHTCDEMVPPQGRVRVVVCGRCSFEGRPSVRVK
jgi:hypothetical protein